MAEKAIKDWKSLSVLPGIVRRPDKGCLKKIIFPLVITTLKRFRSALFQRGKLFQGLSPWPAELFFVVGVLAWRSSALPNNTVCQQLRARFVPQKYQQTHQVPPSHTMAESDHSAADPPNFLLSRP